MLTKLFNIFVNAIFLVSNVFAEKTPELISAAKVWDAAPHCAFTDLIRFNNKWYLTFREGADHVGVNNGVVRILTSDDAENWETAFVFEREGYDMRDPKLSITPENRLMVTIGAGVYDADWKYVSRSIFVSRSENGTEWEELKEVMNNHEWLWRVTWHENIAYGVSYKSIVNENNENESITTLYKSHDGFNFEKIAIWDKITGHPNEVTLRFTQEGDMIALVRRAAGAWIGVSTHPYTDWKWNETKEYVGGPDFIVLPDGTKWASGRFIDWNLSTKENIVVKTALAKMENGELEQKLILPSGGDTSYPGMVYYDNTLWISYYSSHEDNTAIYLAKIRFVD